MEPMVFRCFRCCLRKHGLQRSRLTSLSTPNLHIKRYLGLLRPPNHVTTTYERQQKRQTWTKAIVDYSPLSFKPYLRLIRFDKPIGSWLLYWPCTWSISLAAPAGTLPDLYLLTLFGAGAFFMRGAGCIINDLWDKDYDSKVSRTKNRPLASGEISPLDALTCLAGLLSISLTILLQLNWYSVVVGASSLTLVITYPLFKRFTYWPQAVLGLTFTWGAVLGWPAVQGCIAWAPVMSLYGASFCWTMVYDTIYAHQDKEDDLLIGVKSTALKFGDKTKPWLTAFGSAMISGLTLTGYLCDQTWPYYVGVAGTAGHIAWQINRLNINDPEDCWRKFKSNKYLGLILFVGIVAGNYLKQ